MCELNRVLELNPFSHRIKQTPTRNRQNSVSFMSIVLSVERVCMFREKPNIKRTTGKATKIPRLWFDLKLLAYHQKLSLMYACGWD